MKIERIKWRLEGFNELRTSAPVQADLAGRAERIRDACGEGYAVGNSVNTREKGNKRRAASRVYTRDFVAILDNARNNTLVRNRDRGRG